MEFAFTEDQLAINEAAREMLVETCTSASLRAMLKDERALDEDRWRTICEMGLLGMLAPEAAGGMGLGLTDFVGIAEAAGYVALPEPLVELAGITVPLLARLRSQGFADTGDLLGAAMGGNFIALGHPANRLIANADSAIAFVLADGDDLHVVERVDGTLARQDSFDPFRRLFAAQWTPSPASLAGTGWGDTAQRGAILAAAQMIGLAQRCIDISVAYAKDRNQFGKPIGSYQAVKHLLANAQVKVEFARPVVHAAAAELPLGTLASRARAAHAKIAASEAAELAARTAVQVHGAMGMTWEVDVHFFLKRALALKNAWGTPEVHLATVSERLSALPTGPERTFASEVG
jgi:alkylation response protein AidB-like acyl-CoA dehydrogenase